MNAFALDNKILKQTLFILKKDSFQSHFRYISKTIDQLFKIKMKHLDTFWYVLVFINIVNVILFIYFLVLFLVIKFVRFSKFVVFL